MRQLAVTFSLLGSLTIYALTIDLFDSIVLFLLFGILPGRNTPLSPDQMLLIYSAATITIIGISFKETVVTTLTALRSGFTLSSKVGETNTHQAREV